MKDPEKKPPFFAQWILGFILPDGKWKTPLGDFEEYYKHLVLNKGVFRARLWYWKQIYILIFQKIVNLSYWRTIMFKNYLKTAIRSIKRQKFYSFINISGLAVGMACSILIMLWIFNEISYDNFHENLKDIYLVYTESRTSGGQVDFSDASYYPLSQVLSEECPEVKYSARMSHHNNIRVKYEDKSFNENEVIAADPSFLDIFTIKMIIGDPAIALKELQTVLISESVSRKFFGSDDPIGKFLNINDMFNLKVTGVFEDLPRNSSSRFTMIAPFEAVNGPDENHASNWAGNPLMTYVLLHQNVIPENVEKKIAEIFNNHAPKSEHWERTLHLHPMKKYHLHNFNGGGLITFVYIFSGIALFVLIIANINFINLTTARSLKRLKEVGIRKVVGAFKKNLIVQFFSESMLLMMLSLMVSAVLVVLFLPVFKNITGKEFVIADLLNYKIILVVFCLGIITSLISGSYPALFLSSVKPVNIIKKELFFSRRAYSRKILVVLQFVISIFLIICTLAVTRQINFMLNRGMGYDESNLLFFSINQNEKGKFSTLKEELLQHPGVINVTASAQYPLNIGSATLADWEGNETGNKVSMNWDFVDFDYFKTFKMDIFEGRPFSREYATDLENACVVNEKALEIMGMSSPIGKWISTWFGKLQIVGVVKDFHFRPLQNMITPIVLKMRPSWNSFVFIRIKAADQTGTIDFIKLKNKEVMSNQDFSYRFLEQGIENLYRTENQLKTLLNYFSIFAIIIACLGLLGLISHMAEQKTKEIGVRKVMGASVLKIVTLLTKEFVVLVVIANIVTLPLAFFAVSKYLQSYAYNPGINVFIFILSGFLSLILTLIAIGYQSTKAARANPVDSLRYE
ncbi:ABC transporter permease [candidate division KSB1 bacterium]